MGRADVNRKGEVEIGGGGGSGGAPGTGGGGDIGDVGGDVTGHFGHHWCAGVGGAGAERGLCSKAAARGASCWRPPWVQEASNSGSAQQIWSKAVDLYLLILNRGRELWALEWWWASGTL